MEFAKQVDAKIKECGENASRYRKKASRASGYARLIDVAIALLGVLGSANAVTLFLQHWADLESFLKSYVGLALTLGHREQLMSALASAPVFLISLKRFLGLPSKAEDYSRKASGYQRYENVFSNYRRVIGEAPPSDQVRALFNSDVASFEGFETAV
ncbi:hypothetical protein [Enterovirga aerilata]|uniref:Uncharacterized protein n=1 Tax=Enterovirga aerilata TaxID=2730920 RepID=A0A849I459_9HYPH|nr:hypothetical protein [Enterovirga sp. DB1703]NNM72121.1 hypothetical protein [Enterovirga sp. DB1703]